MGKTTVEFQGKDNTMKFILMFIGISSMFYTGLTLKCYQCSDIGTKLSECKTHQNIIQCEEGDKACKKSTFTTEEGEIVVKDCGNGEILGKNECFVHEKSENPDYKLEAKIDCCGGDLCNGSETILKNNFLFWSFFLFSIFKLFF